MGTLAVAASLILLAASLATTSSHIASNPVRDELVSCNNADYVFVLNVQRKDYEDLQAYQQQINQVIQRARLLTASGVGVGIVTFSKKVEHVVPVTRDLTVVGGALRRLLAGLPRYNGVATGDALLVAKHLLVQYKHRLLAMGIKNCKLLVAAAVSGNRNAGIHLTFAASATLRQVAQHVFAVNLGGGASPAELYRIASDGARGIFSATSILDAMTKTQLFAEVFCPCPLPWTNYDNCTVRGQAQVDRYFYTRAEEFPHNCIRNLTISLETCDCPPNRVDRSECTNGVIRITTVVYSRENSTSPCIENPSTQLEPCGRATGCESFVCPPGSFCVNGSDGSIDCNCTNPNDVFKTTGCESCGDRAPMNRTGPCVNGQTTVVETSFAKINKTYCQIINRLFPQNCSDCPSNQTETLGPCVRGYQQVITVSYELIDGRCFRKLKTKQQQCRLRSEFQCIGSVLSGGQFVTFDGQLVNFPGPCEYLLSERTGQFQVRVRQAIKFPSLPYLTQVDAIVVVIGNASYELTNDLNFKVSASVQPLPFSDSASGVEAFYSDDALVLAVGDLYVQMRSSAATISVRTGAGGLRGILGNCNGSPGDDFTNSTGQDVSQQADPSAALGTSFQVTTCTDCCPLPAAAPACGTNASLEAASVANCGHLTADAMSPFAHCGEAAMRPLLRACMSLYCKAKDNPMWQRSLVCGTLEAAAFRCYLQQAGTNRSSYPIFRSPDFCPKSCGQNAEFVNDADFCPSTCARHFFSSQSLGCATPFGYKSRNVIGQSPLPGCQCKSGFVLDGSNCVLPNECECISNLCIDRENRSVCERWKAKGYCDAYPLQMRRYCKLTCDQCQAPCHDQISKATCQLIKSQGKCDHAFYRQMCQLTCNPSDCECPPCKTVRGPCDPQYKNRLVVTYCYAPDSNGRCQRNQSSSAYEACDECLTQQTRVDTRSCNYCSQEQVTRIVRTVRESTGELRCVEVSTNTSTRSAGCECQSNTNRTVCYRNSEVYLISTVMTPSADCATCNTVVTEKRERNVTCNTVVQKGDCDPVLTKRRPVTVIRGIIRNCQCDEIREQYEEMCVCPKSHWTPATCYANREKRRWFISFNLVLGRCVPQIKRHTQPVHCRKRRSVKRFCEGCNRWKRTSWFEVQNCKCFKKSKKTLIGRCCCPKPSKDVGDCIGDERRITITKFSKDNYECHRVQRVIVEKCRCPRPKSIHECDEETGKLTVGSVIYRLVRGACQKSRQVKTMRIKCKPLRVVRRGPCVLMRRGDIVKHRSVLYDIWKQKEGGCGCKRFRRSKIVACGCREPHVRLPRCPSNCPVSSSHCPRHCRRTRAVIEYRWENGRCQPEERDQRTLPCCCKKPRNKPPKCKHGRVLVWQKYHVKRLGHTCSVRVSAVQKDVTRDCDLTDVRRVRRGDVIVERRRVVRNCRCVWRERRSNCPAHCPKPSQYVRCDGASGEKIVYQRYYRRQACRCLPLKRIRRIPVECPEARVQRKNQCHSEERPAIVIRNIHFYVGRDCRCRKKVAEKRYRCQRERCHEPPKTRLICDRNRLYNVVTVFKRDEHGNCAPKQTRHRVRTPRCTGHRRKRQVKKCIKGRLVLLTTWLQRQHCQCRTKHTKRVVGSCRRYCKERNHGKRLPRRQRCDERRNQLVIYHLMWHFNGKSCVRKWVATQTRVQPDCPRRQVRRKPCDHETGKQKLEFVEYLRHNCKCHGPKVRVSYRKCSCRRPKMIARFCDRRRGRMVVRMLIYQWNFQLDRCHARRVEKSIAIPCHHRSTVRHSPCVRGRMQYQSIRYIRNRRSCKCEKKVKVQWVNCRK